MKTGQKNDVSMIEFASHGDDKGMLTVIEGDKSIPFSIKRLFYIYGTKEDVVRGNHANKQTDMVLIPISGSCTIETIDTNQEQNTFVLNDKNQGLLIPKMVWRRMFNFSNDAVLVVLCSEHYSPNEYINEYEEFIECNY